MSTRDTLSDEQWELIERLLPLHPVRSDGRGRSWKNHREVLNGIIWILRSGVRWQDLPKDFPSYQTCHRRFQQWVSDGTLRKILPDAPEQSRKKIQLRTNVYLYVIRARAPCRLLLLLYD